MARTSGGQDEFSSADSVWTSIVCTSRKARASSQNLMRIAELARKAKVPAISSNLRFPSVGGFMAYAAKEEDIFRRAAIYVDRILKGAKPADLPVEQPTKFELVINMKTAKSIGITIPQSVLFRADRVIE